MKLKLCVTGIIRKWKAVSAIVIALQGLFFLYISSNAQETGQMQDTGIVVVMDSSKSMEDVDRNHLVFDFIKALSASMPKHYSMGFVSYQNAVCNMIPMGSSYSMIEDALAGMEYKQYGNAGAGLMEAVGSFREEEIRKRILLISDGEIMMPSEEETKESVEQFLQAAELAMQKNIVIDILNIGPCMEDGNTVYTAAQSTGGVVYELEDGEALAGFIEQYLFDVCQLNAAHVGKLGGTEGELSIRLPDCLMNRARIFLLGRQQNENLALSCEADRIDVIKGKYFTVIELIEPHIDEVKIQMSSDEPMELNAYLTAEYSFSIETGHTYEQESQTAKIWMMVLNQKGENLLEGCLKDEGVTVYLDGTNQDYHIVDNRICLEMRCESDTSAELSMSFDGLYANYYGDTGATERILVPVIEEEPPKTDWVFWSVIIGFVVLLAVIFTISLRIRKKRTVKKKMIDESRTLPRESSIHKDEFCGKIQVYVIHNKEEIDYPPESINLFARCSREMITLEWILDACNLPLSLKGAEKVIIKPGDDRSLIIKNSGGATALMGREFLEKGRSYHLYYHEKVTFIFDEEETEIEVHYKDLRPNEK